MNLLSSILMVQIFMSNSATRVSCPRQETHLRFYTLSVGVETASFDLLEAIRISLAAAHVDSFLRSFVELSIHFVLRPLAPRNWPRKHELVVLAVLCLVLLAKRLPVSDRAEPGHRIEDSGVAGQLTVADLTFNHRMDTEVVSIDALEVLLSHLVVECLRGQGLTLCWRLLDVLVLDDPCKPSQEGPDLWKDKVLWIWRFLFCLFWAIAIAIWRLISLLLLLYLLLELSLMVWWDNKLFARFSLLSFALIRGIELFKTS